MHLCAHGPYVRNIQIMDFHKPQDGSLQSDICAFFAARMLIIHAAVDGTRRKSGESFVIPRDRIELRWQIATNAPVHSHLSFH